MKLVPVSLVVLALCCAALGGAQASLLAPAATSPFAVGGPSGQVLLGDLDNDGDLDLLTRHQAGRAVRVHLGDGRARFETTEDAVALAFVPRDMKLGDGGGDTSGRSNMRCCPSISSATRCSAAPAWSRPGPISRSSAAPSWPG